MPKDPDAHLSPEEREKVVSSSPARSSGWPVQIYERSHLNSRNDDSFGGWTGFSCHGCGLSLQ